MIVKVNGKPISIVWRYDTKNLTVGEETHPHKITSCLIKEGIGKEAVLIAEGKVTCNWYDTFCKNCGRKATLAKALLQAFPSRANKELRRAFWIAYGEMRHGSYT